MDLLDRLLGHDTWTTRELLLLCRRLDDEQLDRDFNIAHRTVRATFVHMIGNIETWSDLMAGKPCRSSQGRSVSELIDRLDCAASDLAKVAGGIAKRDGWDERWVDPLEKPRVERTFGGSIAHVITHSMHHRAQLLHMMHQLDVEGVPEGDVLSWEQQSGAA